jgi:hypothetical protein
VNPGAVFAVALSLLGPGDLRLIGTLDLPKTLAVDSAPFGGISGVDYDPRTDRWLMISDDRSDRAPARFFVGRLEYDAHGVKDLRLEGPLDLPANRQPSG